MAQIEVKVPQLSESVAEATLLSWHKKVGEPSARDENMIDIETDKVVLELPAPSAGVIVQLIKPTAHRRRRRSHRHHRHRSIGPTSPLAVPRRAAAAPRSAAPPAHPLPTGGSRATSPCRPPPRSWPTTT
jgi:2-oxoglutarate dehydrogenase E2 component (dihydrolipoamide succinyltransferase)